MRGYRAWSQVFDYSGFAQRRGLAAMVATLPIALVSHFVGWLTN